MKWFKPKHSVCKECGVHFEPVTGYEARWGDLCKQHRTPVMERDRKRDAVMQWARENWEKLYEQYEKDLSAKSTAYNAIVQVGMNSMAAQAQQMAAMQGNLSVLCGLNRI